ncbi:hypothetical protein [Roseivirga sp.]|uniref:hypothetical protein n=1 Tax=Roseivirga sp. TaxID=1964215 RepID=UPI003B52DE4E
MPRSTVRQFTHILLASQVVIFCYLTFGSLESPEKLKDLLPKELNKLKFETTLSSFLKKHPNAQLQENNGNFRHVYLEEIDSKLISSVVYYFDADGSSPLYEIIVNFKDEAVMELQANILLGAPNYSGKDGNSKEWKFDIKEDYPLHCWTYRNKIIYVLPLLGTEWNENGSVDL